MSRIDAALTRSPTERETRWLRHLARHGPLSSEILLEFTADTHRCRDTGKRDLKRLRDGTYTFLPPQQRQIAKADFHPYVYDLDKTGRDHLTGLGYDLADTRPTGSWWHAFRTSMLTATIDLLASRNGLRYVPAAAILARSGASLGIPLGRATLVPDQLFALESAGRFRVLALEVDCGTEPFMSRKARKTLLQSIGCYRQAFSSGLALQHYGLKAPIAVLYAFTQPARAARFLRAIEERAECMASSFLVGTIPDRFPRWKEMEETVLTPWHRVGVSHLELFK